MKDIKVYSMHGCHLCEKVISLINARGYKAEVETDVNALMDKAREIGARTAPVVVVDAKPMTGDEFISLLEAL